MDTFIIRIYRREKEEIVGLVEVVEGGEKRSFTDIEGLLGILKIDNRNGGILYATQHIEK